MDCSTQWSFLYKPSSWHHPPGPTYLNNGVGAKTPGKQCGADCITLDKCGIYLSPRRLHSLALLNSSTGPYSLHSSPSLQGTDQQCSRGSSSITVSQSKDEPPPDLPWMPSVSVDSSFAQLRFSGFT